MWQAFRFLRYWIGRKLSRQAYRMTEQEAIGLLTKWFNASSRHEDKGAAVILFGIAYASDMEDLKQARKVSKIAREATGSPTGNGGGLSGGMKLSPHVKIKSWPSWANPRPRT